MKKVIVSIVLISILISSVSVTAFSADASVGFDEFYDSVQTMIIDYETNRVTTGSASQLPTNRLIVKTNNNNKLSDYYGAIYVSEGYKGLHILQYETEEKADFAYQKFQFDNVVYVEYDFFLEIENYTSTDTESINSNLHWNLDTVRLQEAFEYVQSLNCELEPITVAVLDTGVEINHELYKQSKRVCDGDFMFKSITTDENGCDVEVTCPSTEDTNGHGTFIAGILYKHTMNNVTIKTYKITKSRDVEYINLCLAIEKAVLDGTDIINISSYGGSKKPNSGDLFNDVIGATKSNVVVVVCSGNHAKNIDNPNGSVYPASISEAITVGASNRNNKTANFSNYGLSVDICAPGVEIYSSLPIPNEFIDENGQPVEEYYWIDQGTSYAAPIVSAAAALLKSINPEITPAEVERIIKETAYVPEGWDKAKHGEGIINFYNMVVAAVSEKPEFRFTADGKIKIVAPNNPDADIYYSLDYTVPTIEEKLVYSEPLVITDPSVKAITAVCHENGKLISEPVVYKLTQYFNLTVERFQTERPMSGGKNMNITWRSFDPDIAKVDQNGNITGVSVGETQVYAIFDSGLRITYVVTVEPPWWQQLLRWLFFGFIWLRN